MSSSTATTARPIVTGDLNGQPQIPPLENGDRLSRPEFERRYEAMPWLKKAELIEGEVYMPSPVRVDQHGEPQCDLTAVFAVYRHFTPGVRGGENSTVRLDLDNEPQPDGMLFVPSERVTIDQDGYVSGAPDLAAEISASTVSIDLGKKFHVYRRNGVKEYVVWRVLDRAIDWFILREGQFERLPLSDGVYKSQAFPGLWLDAEALIRCDFQRVHEVLQQGLASAEHVAFVAWLQNKGLGTPKP